MNMHACFWNGEEEKCVGAVRVEGWDGDLEGLVI